jgi:hypothetical protein
VRRVRPLLLACLSTVVVTLALVSPVAPASADGPVGPSFTGFRDLVVDDAQGHVFISHGSSQISVRDLDGQPVTSIEGMTGAAGMTLSDDGSTLYVALKDGDAIAAIDTTTLAPTTYPTGVDSCPSNVAITAGLVWFAANCGSGWGSVGALDPSDGTVSSNLLREYSPLIATSPQVPDTLFVLTQGLSPSSLDKYAATVDADGPELTHIASIDVGSNGRDLAITPGGSRVVTASGSPYEHPVFLTGDLSADGAYRAGAYPNAVAIRSDGMVAGGIVGAYDPDVYLYQSGTRNLFRNYDFGDASHELVTRGLAFGETDLYAVEGPYSGPYVLRVITPRAASELTVRTDSPTYLYNHKATVAATLPSGAGETVSIYATSPGGRRKLVKEGLVDVDDRLTVKVPVQRTTTFSASYDGDDTRDAATAEATAVKVRAAVTGSLSGYRSKAGAYHLYSVGNRILFTARVRPNHQGDCVYSRLQFHVQGRWGYDSTTNCMRLASTSTAKASFKGDRSYTGIPMRFRTEWHGDRENLARNSGWAYAKYTR